MTTLKELFKSDKIEFLEADGPKKVTAAVKKVLEDNPDRIYQGDTCYLLPTDKNPFGCVFGAAFKALGVSEEELGNYNEASISCMVSVVTDYLDDAPTLWTRIQDANDHNKKYSEILETYFN